MLQDVVGFHKRTFVCLGLTGFYRVSVMRWNDVRVWWRFPTRTLFGFPLIFPLRWEIHSLKVFQIGFGADTIHH